MTSETTRIVIDARLVSGESGGVESVITGLAHGLSIIGGPEEYLFAVWPGHGEWLAPHVFGTARLVEVDFDRPPDVAPLVRRMRRVEDRIRDAVGFPRRTHARFVLPRRDPIIEALQPSVVHMPRQRGFLTDVPHIYHPHDLQHVHLPQFFSQEERKWRDSAYGTLCRRADIVVVASEWVRDDVTSHFELDPGKVRVIPLAPPLAVAPEPTIDDRAAVRIRYHLPELFILYPAQPWPHKNHVRLFEALALLRSRGLPVAFVGTGGHNPHFDEVNGAVLRLGLEDLVTWTGFVSPTDLRAIYLEARAVIVPTLFEAASAPVWEAFLTGVPTACSNITSLSEQAGDAAILFNPTDIEAIASATAEVWTNEPLRQRLSKAGRDRVAALSWERTARDFREEYRRLAPRHRQQTVGPRTGVPA